MKDKTEINNFIMQMGNKNKIPIIYTQDFSDVVVQQKNKITDKKTRYDNGIDAVLKCPNCHDIISKGKFTNESEDKTKVFCFNCNKYFYFNSCLNWEKEQLWFKPKDDRRRKEYEILISEFIKAKNPKVIEGIEI